MSDLSKRLDDLIEGLQSAILWQDRGRWNTHADFCTWGWALSTLGAELGRVAQLLDHQVECYPNHWQLADDAGMDPAERINRICDLLEQLAALFTTAGHTAQAYHNEAAHIAVDDPEWELN